MARPDDTGVPRGRVGGSVYRAVTNERDDRDGSLDVEDILLLARATSRTAKVDQTQAGKVEWEESDGGAYISRRARVTARLEMVVGIRSSPRRVRLVLSRRAELKAVKTLEQHIDQGVPQPLELDLNSLLALLYQLVSSRFSPTADIYSAFFDDESNE